MRFKEIINENLSPEEILKKYFDIYINKEASADTGIKYTPDGIIVNGDVYLERAGSPQGFPEVPVRFKQITGEFHIDGPGGEQLKNFNNFPNSANIITLFNAPQLVSTSSTTGTVECNRCSFWNTNNLRDFSNSSLLVKKDLIFDGCTNLISLNGLDTSTISTVTLANCTSFQDDLGKLPNITLVTIDGEVSPDIPLIKLLVSGKLAYLDTGDSLATGGIAVILNKYQRSNKLTPEYAFELMRELRAAGFKTSARA